ncbi:MAG: UDP-glucose dehydrogenase family protein [Candidatus Methanospirareceae archaeon]
MRLSIVGSGYVGAVTGVGLAELGHEVLFVDIDEEKVQALNAARSSIFEPGLSDLLVKTRGLYHATTDYDVLRSTDLTFVCVGTPSKEDGSIDLTYVRSAAASIGNVIKQKAGFHLVVVKSTVVPGTTEEVVRPILEDVSQKSAGEDFGVAMTPEFLREGSAVHDFFNPDRIVVGTADERSRKVLETLYAPFNCPKLFTTLKTAEMIKYVSNAFLATKISFANEIGNICKRLGIDVYEVFEGVGLDSRINPSFFRAGIGFGGSCFPKDVRALLAKAEELGEVSRILNSVLQVNEDQPLKLIALLKRHIPRLQGMRIGVLGLAFKPDTDDSRESRAVSVIERLVDEGAQVIAYDPQAMAAFKKAFPQITYATSPEDVLMNTDAVLIVTEWPEFEDLNYRDKIVIDGRRVEKAKKEAGIYEGVCW